MEQQNNTALLVMDMQVGIVAMLPDSESILSKTAQVIEKARAYNIPVIYVVVGFRAATPEISMNNKGFSAARELFANVDMKEFMTVHEALQPQEGEVIVTKRRVSAFTGSDLEVILRAYNARHLVLTGISTAGVVLSTLREAADKDYRLTVIADCCADRDEEVHRVLTTKVFTGQAQVITAEDWING